MQVFYQWYDHLIRAADEGKKIIQDVEKSIETHDYKRFMELRDYLNSVHKNLVFLPDEAFVYKDGEDEYLEIIDITIEENFNKVTDNAYECG